MTITHQADPAKRAETEVYQQLHQKIAADPVSGVVQSLGHDIELIQADEAEQGEEVEEAAERPQGGGSEAEGESAKGDSDEDAG